MFRLAAIVVCFCGFTVALSAQGFDKGDKKFDGPLPPKVKEAGSKVVDVTLPKREIAPGDCEIFFLNGSKVRLIVETEKLDVATIYGNLSVPIEDVVGIDFGLHFPDGHEAKIDAAVRSLGSTDFRVRENAAKTLVDLGPYSYPATLKATKSKDAETAGRTKEITQKLQGKYPKKDLRTSPDDRVVTPTQTIVGRILTPTVKTKAEYFGVVEHKLANMRTLRAILAGSFEADVTIDGGKYAVAGQWLDTTFRCDGRTSILITAKGQVDLLANQGGQFAGPNGMPGRFGPGGAMPMKGMKINGPINAQQYGGVLIGKVGEDGHPFIVGDHYEGNPEREGHLFLHIGPSPWNTPVVGSYEVRIVRKND